MNIIWHGEPCPQEHLKRVEAELAGMLGRMLDSPQQLISHSIFLDNGAAVTAWGETGDEAFHAEFHNVPTKERGDKTLFDRIQEFYEP